MSVPHVTSRRNYFAKNWSRRDQKIILQKKTGNFVEIPTIRKFWIFFSKRWALHQAEIL